MACGCQAAGLAVAPHYGPLIGCLAPLASAELSFSLGGLGSAEWLTALADVKGEALAATALLVQAYPQLGDASALATAAVAAISNPVRVSAPAAVPLAVLRFTAVLCALLSVPLSAATVCFMVVRSRARRWNCARWLSAVWQP